jgi:predicted transcriptional regulator of viral defense system
MAVRTLSDLESKLIMELEWQEKRLVTLQDVMDILDCSYAHARKLAHQLEKKRWLDRLEAGKYQFIPASRGSEAVPDMNPLLAGSVLIAPYYYSYATANHFYGFTPQVPATVYIATTKTKRSTEIRGVEYRFVSLKPSKFFGYRETEVYTAQVVMAEPEKAVVDSLDKMGYAGGIVEVAQVVHSAIRQAVRQAQEGPQGNARDGVELEKLADHALRMGSKALVQRLGYLLETLGDSLPHGLEDRLLAGIDKSKTYLGPTSRWGTGGDYDPKWQVVVNVPTQQLVGEIRTMS